MMSNGDNAYAGTAMQPVEMPGAFDGAYGPRGIDAGRHRTGGSGGAGRIGSIDRAGPIGTTGLTGLTGPAGPAGPTGQVGDNENLGQRLSRPTLLEGTGLTDTERRKADATGVKADSADENSADENSAGEGQADRVPDSPEGYAFVFEPGVEVDEQALDVFKEVAFEQGISQRQASQIAQLYANLVERQQEEERATLEEAESGWLKELKLNRNYAGMVASARLAMERFGTPELNALLNETRLGSHPALVRFVASVGRELGEPVFVQGKRGGRPQRLNFYETMER